MQNAENLENLEDATVQYEKLKSHVIQIFAIKFQFSDCILQGLFKIK
jgi:hypothetical protein